MESNSKKWILNLVDLKKIGIGALIAGSGAALTYITDSLPGVDFGQWSPLVMTAFSILANLIRKWLSNYSKKSEPGIPE